MGAANAAKQHSDLVFLPPLLRAMLDSNDTWPCPTLHSLGDKGDIDFGSQTLQRELPRSFSQRHCKEESTNGTELNSVCSFTSEHKKTPSPDIVPVNPEQMTAIRMPFQHSKRDMAQMIYKMGLMKTHIWSQLLLRPDWKESKRQEEVRALVNQKGRSRACFCKEIPALETTIFNPNYRWPF